MYDVDLTLEFSLETFFQKVYTLHLDIYKKLAHLCKHTCTCMHIHNQQNSKSHQVRGLQKHFVTLTIESKDGREKSL